MKQKHFIDSHKGATTFAVLILMAIYNQWHNPTAWAYLALHGTYGWLWVLKSHVFPEKQWEQKTGVGYALVIWGGLTLYWLTPWLITSRGTEVPAWYLGLCVTMYAFGIFFHYVAAMQKYTSLQLQPEHLIQTGLWARCRNPNYFGELLIYLGFGLLAMHWLPLIVLSVFVIAIWVPNMRKKDRSLSRYDDFAAYKARSKFFIPYLV